MNDSEQGKLAWPLMASVLLHMALLGLFVLVGLTQTVVPVELPVAVELWSSPQPSRVTPEERPAEPVLAPQVSPVPAEPPKAEVNIGRDKSLARRAEASRPITAAPLPKQRVAKLKSATPEVTEAVAKAKPQQRAIAASNKARATARHEANELLADLNSINIHRKPTANRGQTGATNGRAGAVTGGSSASQDGYAAEVQAKVRPLVQLPPGIVANPKAVVLVTLLPTLEVRSVMLLSSSGNSAYDEAVQRAIWEAKTFPALPAGAGFSDYRQLKLEFRPR